MNLKDSLTKTDIFSGVGVVLITTFSNIISQIFDLNWLSPIITFILVTILVIIFIVIKKSNEKRKIQNEKATLENERNELSQVILEKKQQIADLEAQIEEEEQQIAFFEMQIEEADQECSVLHDKLGYYDRTTSTINNILYSLKNNKKCDNKALQALIMEIEFIFRGDIFSDNVKLNTSVFIKSGPKQFKILLSTNHSPGTISKLTLDDNSLVGTSYNTKKTIYCGDIDSRIPSIPFVDLGSDRKYNSILAIPQVLDDSTEYVLVINCTKANCLEETYKKYQDVISRYLELLCLLWFISSDKENQL